jgi:hypothetical protein
MLMGTGAVTCWITHVSSFVSRILRQSFVTDCMCEFSWNIFLIFDVWFFLGAVSCFPWVDSVVLLWHISTRLPSVCGTEYTFLLFDVIIVLTFEHCPAIVFVCVSVIAYSYLARWRYQGRVCVCDYGCCRIQDVRDVGGDVVFLVWSWRGWGVERIWCCCLLM